MLLTFTSLDLANNQLRKLKIIKTLAVFKGSQVCFVLLGILISIRKVACIRILVPNKVVINKTEKESN